MIDSKFGEEGGWGGEDRARADVSLGAGPGLEGRTGEIVIDSNPTIIDSVWIETYSNRQSLNVDW